jgi:hypothetical protein
MNLPHDLHGPWLPGWYLIGEYESGVGSWLLHDGGEALLLEVPEGLTVRDVRKAASGVEVEIKYITASHAHWDHIDQALWRRLATAFPDAEVIHPRTVQADRCVCLAGEPLWLIPAPKHSPCDVVTVFRGAAMTGDIELGMLASVNDEVPENTRRRSMNWLKGFQERTGYQVHTTVSAHLNSVRTNVNWPALFSYAEE